MTPSIFTAAAPGPDLPPEAYLRVCPGPPRGFWCHGDRWAVFGGSVALAEAPRAADRFANVAERARRLLEQSAGGNGPPPRVFGGFAFGDRAPDGAVWSGFPPGLLMLPRTTVLGSPAGVEVLAHDAEDEAAARRRIDALCAAAEASNGHPPPQFVRADPLPASVDGFAAWAHAVGAVLEAIRRGEVHKVVLARALDLRFADTPDPLCLVARVRVENPAGTIYYLEPRAGTMLLGAAPEVLVTLEDGRFLTTAVAGSAARGRTPAEDDTLGRRLLASPKERAEHGFGVDDIVSRLSPFTEQVDIEAQPRILRLHRIQHLETDIAADLQPDVHVLDLVAALHPTAAVSGAPREPAASLLARVETLERGWYAGPVGWCDAAGNGEFAPALRCAVGRGRAWRLFAGAGIVAGSDPDREWSETAMKFQPMLHALGAAADA